MPDSLTLPAPGTEGGTPALRSRAAVTVTVVLGVVGAVAWTWLHPADVFTDTWDDRATRTVGDPVWTSLSLMAYGPSPEIPESIEVRTIEPVLERDGAAVEVDYLICEMAPGGLDPAADGAFAGMMDQADVDRYCVETRPAVGSTYRFRVEPHEELLVGITPTQPGTTEVTGHEISYDVGWQRGEDLIALTTTVRVPQ